MKKLILLLISIIFIISCATTKEAGLSKAEIRNNKKLAKTALVKRAVEDQKYIIKFERMYFNHGGFLDLKPTANYIIIDGEKAVISTAYMGRQYSIRPISGIFIRGKAVDYELTKKSGKGVYEVKLVVDNGNNSFDLFLTVGASGMCSASVSNIRLDNVRYKGYLVPIKDYTKVPLQKDNVIILTALKSN